MTSDGDIRSIWKPNYSLLKRSGQLPSNVLFQATYRLKQTCLNWFAPLVVSRVPLWTSQQGTLLVLRSERFGRLLKQPFFPPHPLHPPGNTELLFLQPLQPYTHHLVKHFGLLPAPGKSSWWGTAVLSPLLQTFWEKQETTNNQVIRASKHLGTIILRSGREVEPTKLRLQYFLPIMHISGIVKKKKKGIKTQPNTAKL